jgi:hypothetical protein
MTEKTERKKLEENREEKQRRKTYLPGNGELNVAPNLTMTFASLAIHFSFRMTFAAVL